MKNITKEMIKQYRIKKLGYDFMGYTFNRTEDLSFHHLIVPKRDCRDRGLGDGYLYWNGAILNQETSHDYLHTIERVDRKLFLLITQEMIEQNEKGYLDLENLRRIRKILLYFEDEHKNDRNKQGKLLIKRQYIDKRIKL